MNQSWMHQNSHTTQPLCRWSEHSHDAFPRLNSNGLVWVFKVLNYRFRLFLGSVSSCCINDNTECRQVREYQRKKQTTNNCPQWPWAHWLEPVARLQLPILTWRGYAVTIVFLSAVNRILPVLIERCVVCMSHFDCISLQQSFHCSMMRCMPHLFYGVLKSWFRACIEHQLGTVVSIHHVVSKQKCWYNAPTSDSHQ